MTPTAQGLLFSDRPAPTVGTLNAIVLGILSDGRWWMPYELCDRILRDHKIRVSDSSLTARLRDARKDKFGGHTIEIRKRAGSTAFEYRLGVK